MTDQTSPHNIEAEKSVLGSMLRDNDVIADVVHFLTAADFYRFAHQKIFEAISDISQMQGKPADAVTVADYLHGTKQIADIGGHAYLVELWDAAPSSTNATYYADIVLQKSIARSLVRTCNDIHSDVLASVAPPAELLDQAAAKIAELGQRGLKEPVTLGYAVRRALDRVAERSLDSSNTGAIVSGLAQLDNLTGGFQPGELCIIAARTSIGKTALALDLSLNVVKDSQIPTLFFSLEMAAIEIGDRACARESGINSWLFRQPKKLSPYEREKLIGAGEALNQLPMFIDDDMHQSVLRLMAVSRRMKKRHKIGLVVADYLQLVQPDNPRDPRHEQLATMTRGLKGLARELKIPVVVLCQLNREADKAEKPKLSHLRESGAIEQDADCVLLLSNDQQDESVVCVTVAKQRNGPTGEAFVYFDKKTGRFSNLTF
jgi:replicative DNA helicase